MAETLNMMEISVDRFINEVKMDMEDGNYNPIIGIGKSGVGKTVSIYELCQEMGIGFCELRLVTLTEVDLLGIPEIVVDSNGNKRTTYASNELLPNVDRDGEEGILVLDEITSATSTIRAAAYQLLDSKRSLGNYHLPERWKIVALGNGPDDGGVFQGIEAAFMSRATCYRIEPELESWKKWAIKKKVNPSVLAFLTWQPESLHVMDPDEIASIFPCPRSWTALSDKLNAREKRAGGLLDDYTVELYAAGAIGAKLAPSFASFYAYNSKTVSPSDILEDKVDPSIVQETEPEAMFLFIQSLIKLVTKILDDGKQAGTSGFKPEAVKQIAKIMTWLVRSSEYKLDYAITAITDLAVSSKEFATLVIMDDSFDELCPDLIGFCQKNSITVKAR